MRFILGTIALGVSVISCAAVAGVNEYSPGTSSTELTEAEAGDGGGADASTADDAPVATDDASEDTSALADGVVPADVALEARPLCSTSSCNGCCDSDGNCTGGQSTGTCGTGGEQCVACSSGQTCNDGVCGKAALDSSAPAACKASTCKACGIAESACCKSDNTCGCAYPFAPCL
jgi:hypothetical protein